VTRYREALRAIDGVSAPYRDEDVATSSCYVMPVMLDDPERQAPFRERLLSAHGVQTSLLYPAIHEFSAYRERFPGVSLPRTELAARTEVTIPLYPHMSEAEQDQVIAAIEEALAA
jgi:dTDP-4-amino-4,6-dideoxygalactose transaminase